MVGVNVDVVVQRTWLLAVAINIFSGKFEVIIYFPFSLSSKMDIDQFISKSGFVICAYSYFSVKHATIVNIAARKFV